MNIQKKFVLVGFISIFVIQSKLKMKSLSTLFTKETESPRYLRNFIVLHLLLVLGTGVLFGQNQKVQTQSAPLTNEVKHLSFEGKKQKDEKKAPFSKQNGQTTKALEGLKNSQNPLTPGMQPTKIQSLKNSENSHLGVNTFIGEPTQTNIGDRTAAPKMIDSERPLQRIKNDQNQISNQSPFESVKGKREDVSKRDAFSKTYQNEDGSYTALIGAGPIHYEKNGQFLDIDHKVVSNPDANFPFANTANLFESYFGANAHKGVKSKTAEGVVLEFLNTQMYWEVNGQAVGTIDSQNPAADIQENKVYYHQLFGQISAEYTVLTGKRELNYIIPNKQALSMAPAHADYLVFSEDILLPVGWTAALTEKGIVVKDNQGNPIYLYENPVSKDASTLVAQKGEQNTIFESIQIGQMLTVKTKVKTEWLLDNERVFPVRVDPTINYYPNNASRWSVSVYNDGDENLTVGYFGLVGNIYNHRWLQYHIKFNTSAVPYGSTINAVTGYGYQYWRAGTRHEDSSWAWVNSADPTTTIGLTLYNSPTALQSTPVATDQSNGWKSSIFTPEGRTYVRNSINNPGYVSLAVYPTGTWNYNQRYGWLNHTYQDKPYLRIDYTAVNCSGTPSGGSVEAYSHVNDPGTSYTVYAFNYSDAPGVEYRWEYRTSTNNGQTWTGWANATAFNSTYSPYIATAPTAGTRVEWRLAMHCTYSNLTGYTTTDTFISSECYQGDGSVGTINDGWQITTFNPQRIANQVVVPQNSAFTVRTITMDIIAPNPVTSATFKFRNSDENGLPGAVIEQFNLTTSRSIVRGSAFGFPWYRVSFDLTTPITLSQGNYWFEPLVATTPANGAFWAVVDTGLYETASSTNNGTTWGVNNFTGHNVFFLVGDCFSCPSVTATANRYSVCEGEEVTLSASTGESGYTYHWYIGYDNSDGTYDEDLGTGQTKTVTVEESTSYWVVATSSNGCEDYTYVTVSVTPPPTLIVMDPIESISCSDETREIKVVSGGIIPETILDETWNPISNPWIVSTQTWGGAGPDDARWALYVSGPSFHSPDNSNFVMVDSFAYGPYEMQSSLISPPMSLIDYNSPTTNITLTFNHYLRYSSSEEAKVEVTTDGTNWTTIQSYTSTQGGATHFAVASIDLNAYKGAPYFQIRFRYHANWGFYWAIDDIKITGTNPLPTTITWSPIAGLWFDEDMTLPYDGSHADTLYASPSSTTTYTISASTSVGCPSVEQVTVERGDKNWISPSSTDWNIAANWNEGGVPTAEHCVRIPSTSNKPIINGTTNAFAKNVVVEDGGGLTIASGGSLTVTDYFRHEGTGNEADVVIKHDGNLIQINDAAVNSGEITVEKDFNFSAERKQYNFVSAPVVSGRNMKTSIYTPNPKSVQQYNTATDYFDETVGPYVSGLAYAVKESPGSGETTVSGELMGVPFNGVLNYPLNTSGAGYNLIGNPYPSNLDIYSLYHSNHEKLADANFFFWDNTNNTLHEQHGPGYNGDHYAKYNAAAGPGGTGTAAPCDVYGSGCNKVPDRFVKVGAGFLVKAASGTLDFNNSYRTTDGSIDFFGKGFASETLTDRYWLAITTPSDIKISSAVVYFEGGNDAFAIDDTESFLGSDDLHSIADGHPLAIQGKAPFHINDQVPLGYKAFENGTYILSVFKTEGVFAQDQDIYLIDKLLGKTVNLSQKPYKFMTRAGQYSDRFVVVYRPSISTGVAVNASNQILFSKQNNQMVIISTIDKITEVELFNLNSRSVYKKTGIHANEHRIDVNLFDHQIVVVTVKTETGEFVTSKFVNH